MFRVVHYLNQFFSQIGGEEKANIPPQVRDGIVGPGMALKKELGTEAEIVATVICGDSYYAENEEVAKKELLSLIKQYNPDIFIAGPAFNAGRYGNACGSIAKAVQDELGIPVITGMYTENPGVDLFKKDIYIISTKDSAVGMREAIPLMAKFVLKLAKGEIIGLPSEEHYIERGIRKNYFASTRGSKRAVEMLVNKLSGNEFETEYKMPVFDRVDPCNPVTDISKVKIALVTSGGIVPKNNPDRIESSSASKYGTYDIENVTELTSETYETAHGGYDPTYVNSDPNRVLPLDVLRELESEGKIGSLHRYFYSTVGNGTAVKSAVKYGKEIAEKLIADGVTAVILTSTWGTCTRCGATMVKEIERAGLVVVHMCTIVPISKTVGANRIVPTIAIPYPLGNPQVPHQDEKALRKKLVKRALKALETPVTSQTVFDK